MLRKICVITNNRADFSRLRTVIAALKGRKDVEVQLFVTGTHLLEDYGYSVREIQEAGFPIAYTMHTEVSGRIPVTMAKSAGNAITELAGAFSNFKPDIVVVHGDRYEALAAAIAASFLNIFVAHIQGGEVSGTIDEHIRHAITKLAHAHFPSNDDALKRIVRLGERQDMVFNVGCPASDLLLQTPACSFAELREQLMELAKKDSWKEHFNEEFLLVAYHPVTTEFGSAKKSADALMQALASKNITNPLLIMWPNIDAGAQEIVDALKAFERTMNGRIGIFKHFPLPLYINILRHAKVMIGNSSSGIREACYFGLPVVDIGTRQEQRACTKNVKHVRYDHREIESAILEQLKHGRYEPERPFGTGDAGKKIADKLATIDITSVQKHITY